MGKTRANIAKLFFVIFIVSLIFSYAFGVFPYEHECIGEECKICYEINLMKNTFENLLILLVLVAFIKKVYQYISRIKCISKVNYHLTPVKLKVKISE